MSAACPAARSTGMPQPGGCVWSGLGGGRLSMPGASVRCWEQTHELGRLAGDRHAGLPEHDRHAGGHARHRGAVMIDASAVAALLRLRAAPLRREWRGDCPSCGYADSLIVKEKDGR